MTKRNALSWLVGELNRMAERQREDAAASRPDVTKPEPKPPR
jgi:hypothetical protein